MNIVDYIAIAVVVLALSAAVFYIVRAKKRGEKCVRCPYAKQYGENCNGGCGHTEAEKDNDKQ